MTREARIESLVRRFVADWRALDEGKNQSFREGWLEGVSDALDAIDVDTEPMARDRVQALLNGNPALDAIDRKLDSLETTSSGMYRLWIASYAVEVDGDEREAWLTNEPDGSWGVTESLWERYQFATRDAAEAAITAYGGLVGGDWSAVEVGPYFPTTETP